MKEGNRREKETRRRRMTKDKRRQGTQRQQRQEQEQKQHTRAVHVLCGENEEGKKCTQRTRGQIVLPSYHHIKGATKKASVFEPDTDDRVLLHVPVCWGRKKGGAALRAVEGGPLVVAANGPHGNVVLCPGQSRIPT